VRICIYACVITRACLHLCVYVCVYICLRSALTNGALGLAEALGLVAAGRVGHEDSVLVLGGDVVHLGGERG
jgi:hypothetical protein